MKLFKFIRDNILFIATLFLLSFIPLYPKIPIVDVQNTWVYVRLEDFVVLISLGIWVYLFIKKKVSLRTPLTIPMLAFWIAGGIATLNGVMILFPMLSNVFANVGFLSYLRRIEYMSLFFIAYFGFRERRFLPYVCATLVITLLLIVGYGFGQKFLGLPAYLTMNEEFAKGIPIQLSGLSRIPSTFAGHYDLAAYLVLIIPIVVSLVFGVKNWLIKILLLGSAALGFVLLSMTVSRVSFFVIMASLALLLILQRKKIILLSFIALFLLVLAVSPRLVERFQSTVSEVEVLVDAKTGQALGQVKLVPKANFKDKVVVYDFIDTKIASRSSVIISYEELPDNLNLVVEPNASTGETLPQGTSYINLSLSPVLRKSDRYIYERNKDSKDPRAGQAQMYVGDFLTKKARAYDLSFTTRFQGEWPKTFMAFERNIFLGSGFGSVSLAVDNDYLRLLGETGLLGFASFIFIFLTIFVYIKKLLPKIDSKLARSFILGFVAGTFGLALNAVLIDVFEASKIAFSYWLLTGIVLALLSSYKDSYIDVYREIRKMVASSSAILFYIFIATFTFFSSMVTYYFAGDDFTWLRWAADCNGCSAFSTIVNHFTQADGFFFRPGTKIYFDIMYQAFWLNQTAYHFVSIFLHSIVIALIFLVSKKLLKNIALSASVAFLFLILSGYSEAVFWISATGFLFNAIFAFAAILAFSYWKEQGKRVSLLLTTLFVSLSLLFHEIGVIVPFLIIAYDLVFSEGRLISLSKKAHYLVVLFPLLPYVALRYMAGSHWLSGDYSYSLVKLPFNFIGNLFGYFMLTAFGPTTLPLYEKLRDVLRSNLAVAFVGGLVVISLVVFLFRLTAGKLDYSKMRVIIFSALFFVLSLLPFLGLGNISSRYSYLATFGFCILFVVFVKKFYEYLSSSGKITAGAILVVTLIIFSSAHLFQLQKANSDWRTAGRKTQNILVSLGYIYAHYDSEDTEALYFINIPTKSQDAWIFPVGFSDALWLVFKEDSYRAHQVGTAQEAFNLMGGTINGRVFEFDSNGKLIELIKTRSGEILPEGQ
ncbi:MAG: O-antigen ligase family protein [Candidatus Levybacteria bacterium]|nr:O-antigen ligase family protein [Candidatus Levybacteria bacterium]